LGLTHAEETEGIPAKVKNCIGVRRQRKSVIAKNEWTERRSTSRPYRRKQPTGKGKKNTKIAARSGVRGDRTKTKGRQLEKDRHKHGGSKLSGKDRSTRKSDAKKGPAKGGAGAFALGDRHTKRNQLTNSNFSKTKPMGVWGGKTEA